MSCGFGAVLLIFLIMNHESEKEVKVINKELLSEVRKLDYIVQEGEKSVLLLQKQLETNRVAIVESDKRIHGNAAIIDKQIKDLQSLTEISLAQTDTISKLKSDIQTRANEVENLQGRNNIDKGGSIITVSGDGSRQYLTGLKVGGKHIVIAIDISASMLDSSIVNVLRRRNMSDEKKKEAPKWKRAIRTVEWIAAQMPLDAKFQVIGFNETPKAIASESSPNPWMRADDEKSLNHVLQNLKEIIPSKGTSLVNLIDFINNLSPLPDNVYLISDSLPTVGKRTTRNATISSGDRLKLFSRAAQKISRDVPLNVILFPMEGDPLASAAFWNLARTSGGSFLSPSRDWP